MIGQCGGGLLPPFQKGLGDLLHYCVTLMCRGIQECKSSSLKRSLR